MYYRLYDTHTKDYLCTGYNCISEEDCLNELLSYINDGETEDIHTKDNCSLESLANSIGLVVETQEQPFEEFDRYF